MREQAGPSSDLVEIAKRNGDFRRNYGIILGAFLYLRSLSAARGRSYVWVGVILTILSTALTWLKVGRPVLPGL
jgi:hypothetical protein